MRLIFNALLLLLLASSTDLIYAQNWTQQNTYLSWTIKDVEFANPNIGYAITVAGGYLPQSHYLFTGNGGIDWENTESGTLQDFLCISVVDENYAWISGETGMSSAPFRREVPFPTENRLRNPRRGLWSPWCPK